MDCILCEAQLLYGLAAEQVCAIRGLVVRQDFAPHQLLFLESEPVEWLFLIRTGYVKLTTSLPDGREQILHLSMRGQMLGLESLNTPISPYTAEALTRVNTCTIRRQDMTRVLEQNPAVSMRLIRMLSEALGQSQCLIRDLGLKSSKERMASFLLSLVPSDWDMSQALPLPLSRHEIAEMLGLTVGTVSRLMAQFQREGLIQAPRGKVRILDPVRLCCLAGDNALPSPVAEAVL